MARQERSSYTPAHADTNVGPGRGIRGVHRIRTHPGGPSPDRHVGGRLGPGGSPANAHHDGDGVERQGSHWGDQSRSRCHSVDRRLGGLGNMDRPHRGQRHRGGGPARRYRVVPPADRRHLESRWRQGRLQADTRVMKHLVVGALIAAGAVVHAQLPVPALYDEWRRVTLDGVVTRVEWANPRAYVFVDVRDAGGVSNWAIEIGNPLDLEQRGWSRTTVRTGDSVSIEAVPARDNAKRALLSTFWTTRPRARVFGPNAATAKTTPIVAGPAPRWPDGQVRLGPPAGRKGYWGAASLTAMTESGSKVSMRADG